MHKTNWNGEYREKEGSVCSVVPSVGVFGTWGVQCVFWVCVQSSCSHLDFKHSQLRRKSEREGEREWEKESSSPERSSWNGINGTDILQDPLEWPSSCCDPIGRELRVECTVCKALSAHKVTIVHVCRKEPLPERTAITLSPSLPVSHFHYIHPLLSLGLSVSPGFPCFFSLSPHLLIIAPSHGVCFISFLFCLSVSLGTWCQPSACNAHEISSRTPSDSTSHKHNNIWPLIFNHICLQFISGLLSLLPSPCHSSLYFSSHLLMSNILAFFGLKFLWLIFRGDIIIYYQNFTMVPLKSRFWAKWSNLVFFFLHGNTLLLDLTTQFTGNTCLWRCFWNSNIMCQIAHFMAFSKWNVKWVMLKRAFSMCPCPYFYYVGTGRYYITSTYGGLKFKCLRSVIK